MLPELHAFKLLFYAESVGMFTSGHVTKMAVTPFDLPLPKSPCYIANFTALSFTETESLLIEVLHCGNREFHLFCEK